MNYRKQPARLTADKSARVKANRSAVSVADKP